MRYYWLPFIFMAVFDSLVIILILTAATLIVTIAAYAPVYFPSLSKVTVIFFSSIIAIAALLAIGARIYHLVILSLAKHHLAPLYREGRDLEASCFLSGKEISREEDKILKSWRTRTEMEINKWLGQMYFLRFRPRGQRCTKGDFIEGWEFSGCVGNLHDFLKELSQKT